MINSQENKHIPSSQEWPEQLAVKVSLYYYEVGMTQQEIASELGITRIKVNRLLAQARERGVVSIRIKSPLLENIFLAEKLAKKFNLSFVEVCLTHAKNEAELAQQLGAATGESIAAKFKNNMTIGLGWGITLKEFSTQLQFKPLKNVSVVSLLGSLTKRSSIMRFEATTDLAAKLNAECLYLPAPIICDSELNRSILSEQPQYKEVHQLALSSDIAIVSIGGIDSATIRQVNLIAEEEFATALEKGAIGNFLGYYIDRNGDVVDHAINQRIIGVAGDAFLDIPERIMLSAGPNKVVAINAVLKKRLLTGLVTDQETAKALLAQQP
jgi:deoxyribonucleoside regulator